jgi:hypothetical protein
VGTVDVPGASAYVANTPTPTNWREELLRIDHNINTKNRVTFRYIHDSWNYIEPTPIWSNANFPTTRTFFDGPGISMLARLTSNISPTLLNEFVVSYTADHISFKTQGYWQRPADFSTQMGSIFNNGGGGKLPAVSLSGGIYDRVAQDPDGAWPEGLYNSNPTYTYRDNVTKIVGRHNLQFGAYFVAAQKNELSQLQLNGALTFDTGSKVSSGNAFADLLLGNIGSFSQGSNQVKFYNRYKIFEPVSYAGVGVMSPAVNLGVAGCGVIADYFRPFHGVSTITRLENMASSTYHALQVSARRSVGALSLSAVYTYSHAIDDGSDRYDTAFVNSYKWPRTGPVPALTSVIFSTSATFMTCRSSVSARVLCARRWEDGNGQVWSATRQARLSP